MSLKIALRPNKRLFFALLGVAVCIMYISSTSAIVMGLREGNEKIGEGRDIGGICVVTRDNILDASLTRSSVVSAGVSNGILGVVTRVSFENHSIFLVGLEGMGDIDVPEIEDPKGILLGSSFACFIDRGNMTINTDNEPISVLVEGIYDSPTFPDDWVLAHPDFVRQCGGYSPESFSFLVTTDKASVPGTVSQPLSSSDAFFLAGLRQTERSLFFLVAIASSIAVLIVYNLMKVEVVARKGDIKVLRGIGGSRRWIISVFALEGGVASLLGGLLGVVLGVVVANLLMSGFTMMGYRVLLTPYVGVDSAIIPVLIALAVGILGGGLAAIRTPLEGM